jgi:hypothetical protein
MMRKSHYKTRFLFFKLTKNRATKAEKRKKREKSNST